MSVNWSDLPRDIFEGIIGRLGWVDRIRIRGVCKAWSVPNRHISAIHKEIPWMLTKFSWSPTNKGQNFQVSGECRLLDPVSGEYVAEESKQMLRPPGGSAWKIFEFNNGFTEPNSAVDAIYAKGDFYCIFNGVEETSEMAAVAYLVVESLHLTVRQRRPE
ncbi:hypothetical protein PVK06_009534 [Gossypium arboreum]|uniref:F-box domain-containing protein n=1 Tax=Gossypium arboreum TaxID=29729 RepID=A0ABR0QMR7_GOSAR|nr:hypothetical protein PVK06_009534 [Gossypium arboreum]